MVLVECAVVGLASGAYWGKAGQPHTITQQALHTAHNLLHTAHCILYIAYYTTHCHIPSRSRHYTLDSTIHSYTLDYTLHSLVHHVLTSHFVPSRSRLYILQTLHCTSCNEYYTEHCNTRHYIIHCLLLTSHCLPHCTLYTLLYKSLFT